MSEQKYYYVLGEGTKSLEFSWPCGIDYDPFDSERPFILWEGLAHGSAGGSFSAQQVLEMNFKEHFRNTGTEWLLPLLHRAAGGERITTEEVLGVYRTHHGAEPTRKDYYSSKP